MTASAAKALRIAAGILAANIFGAFVTAIFAGLLFASNASGRSSFVSSFLIFGIYPSLALVPMGMGVVAAYVWRKASLSVGEHLIWWLAASILAPFGAMVFWHEGLVCLLIGFPILFTFGAAGVLLGRILFKRYPTEMNLTILPLLILAILGEGKLRTDRVAVVTDRLIIHGDPAEVWKHVVEFPTITTPPDYWLNRIGLPSPSETTCEGEFVGAHRRCIFSNGLVFEETVTRIERKKLLTFDIIEQPRDPELLGHLDLHRGEFELYDNGDGTTTLTGRSWYTLHVRPLFYFEWWTRDITSHVHLRVMRHIKKLSEERL
jgi:hypothetical protein